MTGMGRHDAISSGAEVAGEGGVATRRRALRTTLLFLVPALVFGLAVFFYVRSGGSESTENAYAQAGRLAVSAKVDGSVTVVLVRDEQAVSAGQLLFRIDPEPYRIALREAEADLAGARLELDAMRADERGSAAQGAAARAQLAFAKRELARQKDLLGEGISSQAQYDNADLAMRAAQQNLITQGQANEALRVKLGGGLAGGSDRHPRVMRAVAAVDRARLDLRNTEVRAPQDGIVTKVSQLQVGAYVQAAKPLFTLVGRDVWVEANFKENQLARMRVGQRAVVSFDAYPDAAIEGRVAGFSPGTGSSFALLPTENASGNWVKVVQRLPIRITLGKTPAGVTIRAGLSASVRVDVSDRSPAGA